jgi:pimeloyl-ACP methyl ester carboxylesterase
MSLPPAQSVTAQTVSTPRLSVHARFAGPAEGWPVVFLHGNCSDSRFWLETLAALPARFRAVAPDLRGFGGTEAKPIDATRGMRDFSDDLHALLAQPAVFGEGLAASRKVLLVAHSAGAGVAMQYAIDHPERVGALVLEAPMSPYGFGGTKDTKGTPCTPDFAGSGGGTANPDFAQRLAAGDRGEEAQTSPRRVMNECYFKPPFRAPNEEVLLDSVLSTRVGDGLYPGDLAATSHWPGVAPGTRGMNNALSPKYLALEAFAEIPAHPPVLWVRGDSDIIVSDQSLFDLGMLGQLGVVPGWPGAEAYPPQPMVSQTRAVLERYKARGGAYREEVFASCGHSPHIEQAARFNELVFAFLVGCAG